MKLIPFPYDYRAAEQVPDWRRNLILPVDFRTVRQASHRMTRALMQSITQIHNEPHQLAYRAALPALLRWALIASETAKTVEAFGDAPLATTLPEYAYLSGRKAMGDSGIEASNPLSVYFPGRPLARKIVWTSDWTPWWQMPHALLAPAVRAYNRNADLRAAAQTSRLPIRYDNVEHVYREGVRSGAGSERTGWDRDQVKSLFARAVGEVDLRPDTAGRLIELMVERLTPVLDSTSIELAGLRRLRSLPDTVWAGTGGYWASRLVGLEIIRRGGTVRRFHHGYSINVIPYIEGWTTVDLAPSTHFVLPSEMAVERWRGEPVQDLLCAPAPAFEVLQKARTRKEVVARKPQGRGSRARPRVLFAAEQIRGYRQWIPSWFPDAVTMDWTLRLGTALHALPIDLICRPHPEGILKGQRHPLNDIAPVPSANFEQLLPDADVIVLDGSQSRVFCLSLMSDKPVVLIDPGCDHVYAGLQADLEARCTVLKLEYNERGLPDIDLKRLADAVLDTKPPDPGLVEKFRALFGRNN